MESPYKEWSFSIEAIPKTRPLMSLNDRDHHMVKAKKTRAWIEATQAELTRLSLPPMGRVLISAKVYKPTKARYDPHNLMPTLKAVIDGVVRYGGIISDDDYRHVRAELDHGGVEKGAPARIVVTIREIGGDAGGDG